MGLKQSIVIVNEYTIKNGNGGSRGGTPGDYVMRYMGRDMATEDLTPVKLTEAEDYITRYMAREEASEVLDSVPEIKQAMHDAQKNGGVAFGYGCVSLSHEKLKAASKDIQAQFDKGKTVMKTVLSFDESYLRENQVISPDFVFQKRGDYRGNIDQMKLRTAIMHGMDKLSKGYDDLQYVGVIQVDTAHVHCHLAMVDRGVGTLAPDGTQRGMLNETAKKRIRRGIDLSLDEHKLVQQMSSNVTHDRRNALCYIKKFTHRTMEQQGAPQFLLACLPDDKRLWRAGTNNRAMKKPNAIVREFVTQVLDQPDSGYREALRSVDEYARARVKREGLSDMEYRKLYKNGQERIVKDCMNGVYAVLKQVPDREKTVRTGMLEAMAQDYEDMAAHASSDPMIEFGFKLRSYSSRLQHHKKETHKYREHVQDYKATPEPDPTSVPLLKFLEYEEEYNAKLMCKYQHFLGFLPADEEYEEEFHDLMAYRGKQQDLQKLRDDPSPRRMSPEAAEDYGMQVYRQKGGQYAAMAPHILDRRLELMQAAYEKREEAFRLRLADDGLSLLHTEHGLAVSTKKPYDFDAVKALDIHHLVYDFPDDARVSKPNVDEFVAAANKRYELFQDAKRYLVLSGQADAVDQFPEKDIDLMKRVADRMQEHPLLSAARPDTGSHRRIRTVPLGADYQKDMELAVMSTVQSTLTYEDI